MAVTAPSIESTYRVLNEKLEGIVPDFELAYKLSSHST